MAEPATGLERGFEHAAYSPIPTSPQRPDDMPQGAESVVAPQSELAALIRLGTLKQEAGSYSEAEQCFHSALEIGDRIFRPEDPDLLILLNDLTRLYLKQSAYASAEPLLLRLLELKRTKGEDHPEVATVLASLAAVRRALGMHESAEQLWRRVLDIRERTLAPNHFATASALEHLGDACAARGKIREALSAFQRALTIREKTLGSEHPSLRVARERIADLQLQASDDMLDTTVGDTPPAPERYRLLSGDIAPPKLAISSAPPAAPPQSRVSGSASARTSVATEAKPQREKKSTLVIPLTYTPPAAPANDSEVEAESTQTAVVAIPLLDPTSGGGEELSGLGTTTVNYRDALESIRGDLEAPFGGETMSERTMRLTGSLFAFLGRGRVLAAIAVVVLALLGFALATGKRAFGERGAAVPDVPSAAPADRFVATAQAEPTPIPVFKASSAETSSAPAVKARVVEERSNNRKAEKKPDPPARVSIPNLSTAVLSGLDSIAAKAAAVSSHAGNPVNIQTGAAPISQRRATFDDDQANAPQRARLIGELPTPKVPPQVSDVEGEVRVRFNVDSLGRPVLESFAVVSSPNPLLTAAVRKLIPGIRFEPARTAGPDARNIGDIVQIGFQFARSR
jgi:tetratricopeptide (TPR) repeat protein